MLPYTPSLYFPILPYILLSHICLFHIRGILNELIICKYKELWLYFCLLLYFHIIFSTSIFSNILPTFSSPYLFFCLFFLTFFLFHFLHLLLLIFLFFLVLAMKKKRICSSPLKSLFFPLIIYNHFYTFSILFISLNCLISSLYIK